MAEFVQIEESVEIPHEEFMPLEDFTTWLSRNKPQGVCMDLKIRFHAEQGCVSHYPQLIFQFIRLKTEHDILDSLRFAENLNKDFIRQRGNKNV